MLIYLAMIETAEDRAKFEQIYKLHFRRMYKAAYHVLRNQDDAEDAVHEAFVKLIDKLDGIEELDSFRTRAFVSMIARNKAYDIGRARKRRAHLPLDGGFDKAASFSQIESFETSSDLSKAIAMLPESYLGVILLRFDSGFSVREVSQLCDLTEYNTIKRIERAKKKLQKICNEMGIKP